MKEVSKSETRKLPANPNKATQKAKVDASPICTTEKWRTLSNDFYKYTCPVDGCDKNLWLHKKYKPALDAKGEICDREPWVGMHFYKKVSKMRQHMSKMHPDISVSAWPPGFAKRGLHRTAAIEREADEAFQSDPSHIGDTEEVEF